MKGWIAVDLDGTLAFYDEWRGPLHIGEPIPEMLERVKKVLAVGIDVKIFTARVAHDAPPEVTEAIQNWCLTHIGVVLPVTATKDYGMIQLWDDRAVQVVPNTGLALADILREYLTHVIDNYDHEADAHKYNTPCLLCLAENIIESVPRV